MAYCVQPLLPGITDTGKALDGMAKRAKEAGAGFFCAQPLFLKPCSKEIYLGFIRGAFSNCSSPCTGQRFDSDVPAPDILASESRTVKKATLKVRSRTAQGCPVDAAGRRIWRTRRTGWDGYPSSTELIDLHDQGMIGHADIECAHIAVVAPA